MFGGVERVDDRRIINGIVPVFSVGGFLDIDECYVRRCSTRKRTESLRVLLTFSLRGSLVMLKC